MRKLAAVSMKIPTGPLTPKAFAAGVIVILLSSVVISGLATAGQKMYRYALGDFKNPQEVIGSVYEHVEKVVSEYHAIIRNMEIEKSIAANEDYIPPPEPLHFANDAIVARTLTFVASHELFFIICMGSLYVFSLAGIIIGEPLYLRFIAFTIHAMSTWMISGMLNQDAGDLLLAPFVVPVILLWARLLIIAGLFGSPGSAFQLRRD